MNFSYSYRNLFLLITIVCGVLIFLRYLKKRRFREAIVIIVAYFLPLTIIVKVKHPLASLLKQLLRQNVAEVELVDLLTIIILSPLLFFLIFCLSFGGYDLFFDDIDLAQYLKNHFRKRYIKSKVVGFSLMTLGLILLLLPMTFFNPGIWQLPFITVSLSAYFIGSICVLLPRNSENKIEKIICKIKNSIKRH